MKHSKVFFPNPGDECKRPQLLCDWLATSIAHRAAFAGALFGLSLMLFLGLIAIPVIYHQVSNTIEEDNEQQTIRLQELFEYRLDTTLESVQSLAKNSFVVNAFVDSSGRELYLQPLLRNYQPPLNMKGKVVVLDINLNPIAASAYENLAGYSSLPMVSHALKTGSSQINVSVDGHFLLFAAPVFFPPASSHVGVVLLEIPLKLFFVAPQKFSSENHCYAVAIAGRILYASSCAPGVLKIEDHKDKFKTLKYLVTGESIELLFKDYEHSVASSLITN